MAGSLSQKATSSSSSEVFWVWVWLASPEVLGEVLGSHAIQEATQHTALRAPSLYRQRFCSVTVNNNRHLSLLQEGPDKRDALDPRFGLLGVFKHLHCPLHSESTKATRGSGASVLNLWSVRLGNASVKLQDLLADLAWLQPNIEVQDSPRVCGGGGGQLLGCWVESLPVSAVFKEPVNEGFLRSGDLIL